MNYSDFKNKMINIVTELENVCGYKRADITTKSEEEENLTELQLILTEMFDIQNFVKAVQYYNKPTAKQGHIRVIDNKPVFYTGTEQIPLDIDSYIECGINEDAELCYDEDEVYCYQLDKLEEVADIATVDHLCVQIRM